MTDEKRSYRAYMLRMWQIKVDGEYVWRVTLESSLTGERLGFANLDALFTFLRQQTGAAMDLDEGEGGPGKRNERRED